ncbi:MAG: hypothetical protein ACJ74G_20725 [Blastocatellia bacterium]
MIDSVLLRAIDLTKSYAGVQALKSASFELRTGEVHAWSAKTARANPRSSRSLPAPSSLTAAR